MVVSGEKWYAVVSCGGFIILYTITSVTTKIGGKGVGSCPRGLKGNITIQ